MADATNGTLSLVDDGSHCDDFPYHEKYPCAWPYRTEENCTVTLAEHLHANGPSFMVATAVYFGFSMFMCGIFSWRILLLVKSRRSS